MELAEVKAGKAKEKCCEGQGQSGRHLGTRDDSAAVRATWVTQGVAERRRTEHWRSEINASKSGHLVPPLCRETRSQSNTPLDLASNLAPAFVNQYAAGLRICRRKAISNPSGKMSSRGQMPPTAKARVVLQPLRTQKLDNSLLGKESPEMRKTKRKEEEEKETKEETRLAPDITRPIPDIRGQAVDIEKKVIAFCLDPRRSIKNRPQPSCGTLRRCHVSCRNSCSTIAT